VEEGIEDKKKLNPRKRKKRGASVSCLKEGSLPEDQTEKKGMESKEAIEELNPGVVGMKPK